MLLSQLIEEKSNKVIEVLAAAVPVDAIFVGKLFAMLAMSLLGIAVWTVAGAAAIAAYSTRGLSGLPPPAVGWPAFLALVLVYFAMSYLLIGSVFLGIGAQASTVREVQTLSMPVTMAQVVIFAFASAAVGPADIRPGWPPPLSLCRPLRDDCPCRRESRDLAASGGNRLAGLVGRADPALRLPPVPPQRTQVRGRRRPLVFAARTGSAPRPKPARRKPPLPL